MSLLSRFSLAHRRSTSASSTSATASPAKSYVPTSSPSPRTSSTVLPEPFSSTSTPPNSKIIPSISTEEEETSNESQTRKSYVEDVSELGHSSSSRVAPKSRLGSLLLLSRRKNSVYPVEDTFRNDDSVSAQSRDDRYRHNIRSQTNDSHGTTSTVRPLRVGPGDQWKKGLGVRVKDSLRSMVRGAKQNLESQTSIGVTERGNISAEYSEPKMNIRHASPEALIEQEHQAANQATPPQWDLVPEQGRKESIHKSRGSQANGDKPIDSVCSNSNPTLRSENEIGQREDEYRDFTPLRGGERSLREDEPEGNKDYLNGPASPVSLDVRGGEVLNAKTPQHHSGSDGQGLNQEEEFPVPEEEIYHKKERSQQRQNTITPSTLGLNQEEEIYQKERSRQERQNTITIGMPPTENGSSHIDLGPYHTWSEPIIAKIRSIFDNKSHYKHLSSLRGLQAQRLLDLLQKILNVPTLEDDFRNNAVTVMRELSSESGRYPECLDLGDVVQLEGDGPIAAGCFADIYKGHFRNQRVRIKMIRAYQTSQVDYIIKHVSRGVMLWNQLSHKNLLPFYGIYQHSPRRVCLISSWAQNGDIRGYLIRNPNAGRAQLSLDVAAGISYLHEQGIIHGSVKGANVLVDDSGIARLADFGFSGVIDSQILSWTSQSSQTSAGGSVRWEAPELLALGYSEDDGKSRNSKPSDVYAWSSVCYEIFTSQDPFYEDTRHTTVMLKVIEGETPSCPPQTSAPWSQWGLTKPVWELMNCCWAYDPTERPVIDDVVAALNKETTLDHRPAQRCISPQHFCSAVSKLHQYSVEDLEAILSI